MRRPILTLRISRRAIGAAVLVDESLRLIDGRHLPSRRERAYVAAARYVERLLDLSKPGTVVLDAPQLANVGSDRLLAAVESVLRDRHVTPLIIRRSELLNA